MEQRLSLLLVTVFYLVLFVSGLVGNLLVCLVIVRSKMLHSAMNYYLVSLAVADLVLLLLGRRPAWPRRPGLPNELLLFWHQYPWPFGSFFCSFRSFLSERYLL
jgi:hypothetical protein